jgi:hypothetical protein
MEGFFIFYCFTYSCNKFINIFITSLIQPCEVNVLFWISQHKPLCNLQYFLLWLCTAFLLNPEVTNNPPLEFFLFYETFKTVIGVPCTIPCGPMYIILAVICPYWETQRIHFFPIIWFWIIWNNHSVSYYNSGAFHDGNNPIDDPEYIVKVCSWSFLTNIAWSVIQPNLKKNGLPP